MEVDDVAATSALVEVVDVLGNDRYVVVIFEGGDELMAYVWFYGVELRAPLVVEIEDQFGVGGEAFGAGHVFHPVVFPEPVTVAESGYS